LRRRPGLQVHGGRLYQATERAYGRLLAWSLVHRWAIVLLAVATFASVVPLARIVGKTFLPQDDQSEFEVSLRTPGGFPLGEIEQRVRGLRGVTDVLTTIGDQSGRVKPGEGDVTTAQIYVRMSDLDQRSFSQFDVMAEARRIVAEYPDLRASVQGVNPLATGGARISDLELNLRGPDLDRLQEYSDRLMAGMRELPGLVDVDTTLAVRTPELRLLIDREKASDQGVNVQDIAATVQTFVAGQPISKFKEADERYDIWLRAEPGKRRPPQDVYDLTVLSRNGQLVRLGNLVHLREELGPAEIDRVNRQRSVTIVGNLLPSLPLATGVEHVKKVAATLDMPALYDLEFTGRAKGLAESNSNFALAFVLSIVFM